MKKTIVGFDLIKLDNNQFIVEPTSVYVEGYFNWIMLDKFLFEDEDSCLSDIGEGMTLHENKHFTIEIWEDSDDDRSWIDYNIIQQEAA